MTDFNKGWWNCFISFAGSLIDGTSDDSEKVCRDVMEGAGITEQEIDEVLEKEKDVIELYPKVKEFLEVYQAYLYALNSGDLEEEGGEND